MAEVTLSTSSHRLLEVSCDLCGANDAKPLMQKRGVVVDRLFNIVGCRRCGHVYVNPRLDDAAIAALYDEEYYQGRGFDRTIQYAKKLDDAQVVKTYADEVRTLKEALGSLEGRTAIDIGCGAGGFVRAMRAAGADAVGFDTSEQARLLCERDGVPLTAHSIDELYAQGKTYDIVTAMEVIEHTLSPTEFLRSIKTLIKPGGLLLVGTGNWNLIRLVPGTPYVMPEGHIQYFTPVTLADFFHKAGLQTIGTFNFLWAPWREGGKHFAPVSEPLIRLAGSIAARVTPSYGPFPLAIHPIAQARTP